MGWIIFAILFFIGGFVSPLVLLRDRNVLWLKWPMRLVCFVVSVFCLLATSYVVIDADKVGHLKRVYLGSSMPAGKIIALHNQMGPQAEILPPGFQFRPLLNVIYRVEQLPVVDVPEGKYGFLVAADGLFLEQNQYLAPAWPKDALEKMLDAEYFLTHGGQKGPQLSILLPGRYRINRYLFDVEFYDATDIPAGFVGVIKSNVQETPQWTPAEISSDLAGKLVVPLVKKGSIGVWDDPFSPGRYYLNGKAYEIKLVETRVYAWLYQGNYQYRQIDLIINQDGKIEQKAREEFIRIPENAADGAILTHVERWVVPQEIRVQVQVEPKDAPFLVAAVGDIHDAEDKIVTPAIQSVVRNVCAGETIYDFLTEKRHQIEEAIEKAIVPEGRKAGVTIKDVRLLKSAIPPEPLVALLREQLAVQLEATYRKEQVAQNKRIETEKARAAADQQPELMKAEIGVKVAEFKKQSLDQEGQGAKLKLEQIAQGQKAQVEVLGQEKVVLLAFLEKFLEAAQKNPDWVKIPHILVINGNSGNGNTGSLEGAAAILGESLKNIFKIDGMNNNSLKDIFNGGKN